ncbi:Hypothetical protein, putative [Bodo saltans]|uniref:Uncharacterized protein n=1 Tax=Bodo saltans TaxID=75058 RepID=A0A0S4IPW2_BODSA|nr:Hypothetical protein, putative [Bodo saltans]|eukprot:CUE70208.1 Hypothetical protein, putative [Bodo saltans]
MPPASDISTHFQIALETLSLNSLVELARSPPSLNNVRCDALRCSAERGCENVFSASSSSEEGEATKNAAILQFQNDVTAMIAQELESGRLRDDGNSVDVDCDSAEAFLLACFAPLLACDVVSRSTFLSGSTKDKWDHWCTETLKDAVQLSGAVSVIEPAVRFLHGVAASHATDIVTACYDLFTICARHDIEALARVWACRSFIEIYATALLIHVTTSTPDGVDNAAVSKCFTLPEWSSTAIFSHSDISLLPGGTELAELEQSLFDKRPTDIKEMIDTLLSIVGEHPSRGAVIQCFARAVQVSGHCTPELLRQVEAAALGGSPFSHSVAAQLKIAVWLTGGNPTDHFDNNDSDISSLVNDLLALALAFPAFPITGPPRVSDCIFLDEFSHRIALEAQFQQAITDRVFAATIESALQQSDSLQVSNETEPSLFYGAEALLSPCATHRLASFKRMYILYAAKFCGELVDEFIPQEVARRYLITTMLQVAGTHVDDVRAGICGLGHFPYDATTGFRAYGSEKGNSALFDLSSVRGCTVLNHQQEIAWNVTRSTSGVLSFLDVVFAAVAWDLSDSTSTQVSIEPFHESTPFAPLAQFVASSADRSNVRVSDVLKRLLRCGFITIAPLLLDSFESALMALDAANVRTSDWGRFSTKIEAAVSGVLDESSIQLLSLVLDEMAQGSRHLMDTLQHCDSILKMLITGQQVSSLYPFSSMAFDVRDMAKFAHPDDEKMLRFALEDVFEASLIAQQQLLQFPGVYRYRICVGIPDVTRQENSFYCEQRAPIAILRGDVSVPDDEFTKAMTQHFYALSLVFPEFQRLAELLQVYAIAHTAFPLESSAECRSIISVTLVPTAVWHDGGNISALCGAVDVKPKKFFDPSATQTFSPRVRAPDAIPSSSGFVQWVKDHPDLINTTLNAVSIGATVAVYVGTLSNPVGIAIHLGVVGAGMAYEYVTSGKIDVVDAAASGAMAFVPRILTAPIHAYEVVTGNPFVKTIDHKLFGGNEPEKLTYADRANSAATALLSKPRKLHSQASQGASSHVAPAAPLARSAPLQVPAAAAKTTTPAVPTLSRGAQRRLDYQSMKAFETKQRVQAKQYAERRKQR